MPPKSRGGKPSSSKDSKPESSSDTKGKTKDTRPAEKGKINQPDAQLSNTNAPKKPDTRTLISGSASWTGKLPVNLLSEACQKNKWDKPEYSMRQGKDGFISSATLKRTDPKTKEVTVLPTFHLPSEFQHIGTEPTAVEARHFAATWALYRFSSMKNIHMMLPPKYKDLWKSEFPNIKEDYNRKGLAWMFEADPFFAREEQNKLKAIMEQKKQDAIKKAQSSAASQHTETAQPKRKYTRDWENVPSVEMGHDMRANVEDIVRKYGVWNRGGVSIPEKDQKSILKELTGIGFRYNHVMEAIVECKDREEVIEWLLIHIPEDDLPPWCLPEGYHVGVTFVTGDRQKEAFVERLTSAGYSVDVEKAYEQCNANIAMASEVLQHTLCQTSSDSIDLASLAIQDDDYDTWAEEAETLSAIFSDRYQKLSDTRCSIVVESGTTKYTFQFEKSAEYPKTPAIVLNTEKTIPAYIKLDVYKRAYRHAVESLLGEPMIFSLCDWLEAEIPGILANPSRLKEIRNITKGVAGIDDFRKRQNKQFSIEHIARKVDWSAKQKASIEMRQKWLQRQSSSAQQNMLSTRQRLPAWAIKDHLIEVVTKNQVTIISGATGSGKSTQSPQFILDDLIQKELGAAVNIVVTQPRRVSALGLADRVSDERCTIVGDEVGYSIRGDSKQTQGKTKITFMTTGVLLRRLQSQNGLADVTHVFIDEIHERTLDSDFLLGLLKDYLAKWKDLKLILMSATLDSNIFESYFQGFEVGMLEIQGRTFDVTDHYLDDVIRFTEFNNGNDGSSILDVGKVIQGIGTRINYDLIVATTMEIHGRLDSDDGSILIFLPGVAEIDRTVNQLKNVSGIFPLPLHASLHPSEQKRVFVKAPRGMRKVIAATNVAETSITIDDCVAVIDTGRVKETSFDPQLGMIKLEEVWASRAACQQRRGRAGRVRPGDCYKLFTRKAEESMKPRPDPEIKRVPLEQLLLSIYALGIPDAAAFLSRAITPPDTTAVEVAVDLLRRMNALDGEELTALGSHLSRVPADLRLAKLMIYGAMFNCLDACLNIAAILTVKSPFVSPQQKREEVKSIRLSFSNGHGDLLGDLAAFDKWIEHKSTNTSASTKRWCEENFLSTQTLFDINSNKSQFISALKDAGFLSSSFGSSHPSFKSLNANSQDLSLLRSLIAGSFAPQIARIGFPDQKYIASVSGAVALDPEARMIKYFTQDMGRVFIHPGSVLFDAQSFPGHSGYMSFFSKMATSKTFIRDLTPFNVFALLMFAGDVKIDTLGRGLVVDGWLRVRGWARIGVLIGRLRVILDRALERKLEDPSIQSKDISEVIEMVRRLIQFCGMDR